MSYRLWIVSPCILPPWHLIPCITRPSAMPQIPCLLTSVHSRSILAFALFFLHWLVFALFCMHWTFFVGLLAFTQFCIVLHALDSFYIVLHTLDSFRIVVHAYDNFWSWWTMCVPFSIYVSIHLVSHASMHIISSLFKEVYNYFVKSIDVFVLQTCYQCCLSEWGRLHQPLVGRLPRVDLGSSLLSPRMSSGLSSPCALF